MLRTVDRYVIREVIPPFLLSLLVFTFILEVPPVMQQLETLVSKGVSWQVAGRIILLLIPQGLGLTIPMALLTGLLIGLGRLSSDRETVALLACGVSPYRLLRPVLVMATVAAAATLYVMVEAIPDANQRFREITFDVITKRVENDIHPRVFFEDFPGWVLYARDEAPGGGWKDVLVSDTRKPEATSIYLSAGGRLALDRPTRRVDLILVNGIRYSTTKEGETDTFRFPTDQIMSLDADTVFGRMELPRGVSEKTIPQLKDTIEEKRRNKISPHPEIMAVQQKFSIPAACFVFALIGLALGVTVARDSKAAGFVLGIAVIFAYYVVMFLAESFTKGLYAAPRDTDRFLFAYAARWLPDVVLGVFGVGALIWRARFAERKFPLAIPIGVPRLPGRWRRATAPTDVPGSRPASPGPSQGRRVVIVVKIPRLRMPGPGLLDRYVSRLYVRVVGLSFLALMGLFYIATFIDKSDKLFKGQASTGTVLQLLAYSTPQFVYYVIPIAALLSVLVTFGILSRTSELTVMKACGVSLYRIALPLVGLSLLWSAVLFGLEQEILARANRRASALDDTIRGRPVKTLNPLNRHWIIARDGSIYHYGFFDPQQRVLTGLSIYKPAPDAWRLVSQTYATTAQYADGWVGANGWMQDLSSPTPTWRPFTRVSIDVEPPEYFETEQTNADTMTVAQLRRHVAELSASGFDVVGLSVELQRKLAFPLVTFVMTLLAVPFGVSAGRRGTLYGIGLGVIIALSYWFLMSVFIAIGKAGLLAPPLAAWTPNIIVAAAAVYLLLTAKT